MQAAGGGKKLFCRAAEGQLGEHPADVPGPDVACVGGGPPAEGPEADVQAEIRRPRRGGMRHAVAVHLMFSHIIHVEVVHIGVKLRNIAAPKGDGRADGCLHGNRLHMAGNFVEVLVQPPGKTV